MTGVVVSQAVAAALGRSQPVVAMESTVYSTLGLPDPHNARVLAAAVDAVDELGAVAAMTAVIDGRPVVGVDDPTPILTADRKVAARDLAVAMAQRWPIGVTTVGASLTIAGRAGLDVFATGGIGGVHRGAAETGDISGDLPVIAQTPMVTVCAGAKSFLDLRRTLELLETLGVAVIGFGTDELPAFTTVSSGLAVPHRSDEPAEIAELLRVRRQLGQGGVLVCVPPPEPLDPEDLDRATARAHAEAAAAGIDGSARTPFVLAAIARHTDGRSVAANTALVVNNARVAARIAAEV